MEKSFQWIFEPWEWQSKNCCEMTSSNYFTLTNYQALLMVFEKEVQPLWIDNLIKPIFICLLFVRAEEKGNGYVTLHQWRRCYLNFMWLVINYARHGSYYLSTEVLEKFMKEEHETPGRLLEWNIVSHVNWNYICEVWERSWRNCRSYIAAKRSQEVGQ